MSVFDRTSICSPLPSTAILTNTPSRTNTNHWLSGEKAGEVARSVFGRRRYDATPAGRMWIPSLPTYVRHGTQKELE